MARLTSKVAIPIILVGLFAIAIFIAMDFEKLELSFYVVLFLLTVYVFFFGFAMGQSFASPIKKLLDRANELKRGNLSSRAYLETKDELSELAKVFNEIAEELEASRLQNENTEKSVDIKVRARTQALEETINALEQKIKNRTIELEKLIKESAFFQEQAKEKNVETAQLKQQLNSFKPKINNLKNKEADLEEKNA